MNGLEINCRDLSKTYSSKVVFKELSFKIPSFGSLCIRGQNGSGKSTLIKILANLIQPTSGTVSIIENNTEITRENSFLKTGLLSPYLNLYDELTGYENLEFFLKLRMQSDGSNSRVNEILKDVGLHNVRNELLKNYSSGMKQRLKIAFSILHDPEILLLDEPRSNLDDAGVEIIKRIAQSQKQRGILVIATNDSEDVKLCERTLNIEDFR